MCSAYISETSPTTPHFNDSNGKISLNFECTLLAIICLCGGVLQIHILHASSYASLGCQSGFIKGRHGSEKNLFGM